MLVIYGTLPNGLLLPGDLHLKATAIPVPSVLVTNGLFFDPNAPSAIEQPDHALIEFSARDESHYGHHHFKNPLQPPRRKWTN